MGRKRRATARKGTHPKSSRRPSPDEAAEIAERLSSALNHHQSGDLEQAEILYRQVLARMPEHPDALHLYGVLAHQTGRLEEAGKCIARAIELFPQAAGFHNSLGNVRRDEGRGDEAAELYLKTLSLDPGYAEAHVNLANLRREQGRPDEAARHAMQALASDPAYAAAHEAAAAALQDLGKPEEAADHFQTASSLEPQSPEAHANLAASLWQLGRQDEAIERFREALTLDSDFADAHNGLTIAYLGKGELAAAAGHGEKALAARPDFAAAHVNLAAVRRLEGRPGEALEHCRRAAGIDSGFVEAHVGMALARRDLGAPEQAIGDLETALSLAPDDAAIQVNLAVLNIDLGRLEAAESQCRAALVREPELVEARINLGAVLNDLGRHAEAAPQFDAALELRPDNAAARIGLAQALSGLGSPLHDDLGRWLEATFASPDVRHQEIAAITAAHLKQVHPLGSAAAGAGGPDWSWGALGDPVLHALLEKTVNVDAEIELALTALRRDLLLSAAAGGVTDERRPPMRALARQACNNGGAFWLDDDEKAGLEALRADLEASIETLSAPGRDLEDKLLAFAMYAPLAALDGSRRLREFPLADWSPWFAPIVEKSLIDPLEEEDLMAGIGTLGDVADATSQAVQAQYDENPYPRWLSIDRALSASFALRLKRQCPHATAPQPTGGILDVLVAGCGTGQHPITLALANRDVRVLGVDLSRRSLAYGARMARRLGIGNVEFSQADILELSGLGRTFAVIESVGVLHHLARPEEGWSVLTGLLAPGGVIKIGLYSATARRHINAARERVAASGIAPAPDDIRRLRRQILLGREHAELSAMARLMDFYDLNGCRDMLFHVQEQSFTLERIGEIVGQQGLDFIGFEFSDPSVKRSFAARHPDDPGMTDLARWAAFEREHPDTFEGMYVFWCQKPLTAGA